MTWNTASLERVRRRRTFPEADLQRAVSKMLALCLPHDAFAFAVPNGDRGVTLAPGTVSGVPDLMILHRGKAFGIELKSAKGRLSDVQKAVHGKLNDCGVPVAVCRSLDEVDGTMRGWVPGWKGRAVA